MEFYFEPSSLLQSDKLVSIPNGMEFYQAVKVDRHSSNKVSIPNGMEFYAKNGNYCRNFASFNSQRDGIILYMVSARSLRRLFQFPTGWNLAKDFK